MTVKDIDGAVKFQDIDIKRFGNDLNIMGAIYGNAQEALAIFLPDEDVTGTFQLLILDSEDWKKLNQQTDQILTEVVAKAKDGILTKAIVRKCERQIDQKVAWKVFKRDGYICVYCRRDDVPLTVDHIVLWEGGGATVEDNLLSACKSCNKRRGNTVFPDWIAQTLGFNKLWEEIWTKAQAVPLKVNVASR